jgi:hypothetical protein
MMSLVFALAVASGLLLFKMSCQKIDTSKLVPFSPPVEQHASDPLPGNSSSSGRMCAAAPLPQEAYFVIQTYDFTDTVGGITVLHFLADRLNR